MGMADSDRDNDGFGNSGRATTGHSRGGNSRGSGPGDRSTGTGSDYDPRDKKDKDKKKDDEKSFSPAFSNTWGREASDFSSGAFTGPNTEGLEGSFRGPNTDGLKGSFKGGGFGEHEDLESEKDRRGTLERFKGAAFAMFGDEEEKAKQQRHDQWSKNVKSHLDALVDKHGDNLPDDVRKQIDDFNSSNSLQTAIDTFASLITLGTRVPGLNAASGLLGGRGQGDEESNAAFAGRSLASTSGMDGLTGMGLSIGGAVAGANPDAVSIGNTFGNAVAKSQTVGEGTPGHDPHSSGNGPKDRTSSVSVSSAPQMTIEDVIKLFAGFTQEPVEEEPKPFEFANLDLSRLGGRK